MKTVFHWKEMLKGFGLVVLAGTIVGFLGLPEPYGFLAGSAAGAITMVFSMCKWEMFHFESS